MDRDDAYAGEYHEYLLLLNKSHRKVVIIKIRRYITAMTTYHIEYIIHLEIEAEGEDEALRLGSQELHALDGDGLANCCEFLDIEIALTDDYYLGETE